MASRTQAQSAAPIRRTRPATTAAAPASRWTRMLRWVRTTYHTPCPAKEKLRKKPERGTAGWPSAASPRCLGSIQDHLSLCGRPRTTGASWLRRSPSRATQQEVAVAPAVFLPVDLIHDGQARGREPSDHAFPARVVVVARYVALGDLAQDGGQAPGGQALEGLLDVRLADFLDRHVEAAARPHRPAQVRQDRGPVLRRDVL